MQHAVTGAAHRNKSGPVDSCHAYGEDLKTLEKIEYADRALVAPFVFVYPNADRRCHRHQILGESDLSSQLLNQSIKCFVAFSTIMIREVMWNSVCFHFLASCGMPQTCVIGVNYLVLVCNLGSNPDLYIYLCFPNFVTGNELEKFSLIMHSLVLCACS